MSDDRGLAALAEAFEIHGYPEGWIPEAFALAILGERAVFWPTGTEEYRELIRQYQAEIARLRSALEIIAAQPEPAPNAIPVSARNIARAALGPKP